mmetsp:Transcript_39735/g.77779  ORF Transcript_39735/g.77779 Transcript_39735/m.77779 type:complete len:334 (-) Transcript_39735:316-1317(-)|eukprot:CAMPEP_0173388528 /NCGR_PEP_ID=MMETSP1356-20130122/10816_1 /TAXON_ID=77927 ORGANISM="Hemiselmis virescens, Strain PCC157" /NCGR_SAMPLE_ID=MMETSP1356 /ASSEMBLY_ACC=CAM_ASM_000847 /LENGTH=333 /DNA_ID=CAMNT_0014345461 /DNA_START=221 /DNA_END=1222 /DNA_ORIENTATION=+
MRGDSGRISPRYLIVTVVAIFFSSIFSGMIGSHLTKAYVSNKLSQKLDQRSSAPSEASDKLLSICTSALEAKSSVAPTPTCPPQTPCAVCPEVPSASPPVPHNAASAAVTAAAAMAAADADAPKVPLIELPDGIKNVIINIGTNYNPIMPPEDDLTTMVIAVEPILETAARIKKHPRLSVILAAIASGDARFQTMQVHNVGGASSSLAAPTNKNAFWVGTKKDGWPSHQIVPVMSMATLLESIPKTVNIKHLKTDMQGFDFAAVSSAGRKIRRIPEVYAEVYVGTASYEGVKNDLWKDWEPYMKSMGYKRTTDNVKKRGEDNALWVREGTEEF